MHRLSPEDSIKPVDRRLWIIFSVQSDACVWTEWFDHDTPCNSNGDTESHEEHFMKLQESWTGSMRICKPTELVTRKN